MTSIEIPDLTGYSALQIEAFFALDVPERGAWLAANPPDARPGVPDVQSGPQDRRDDPRDY